MNEEISKLKIVGIGGLPRSGKDKLAEIFMESGFFGVSLGQIVRDASAIRHKDEPDPISVKNMTETSNWLRETKGPDFALKEALNLYNEASKSKQYKGLLLYSVRAPVEVDFILVHEGQLIWIATADKIRHERSIRDLRPGELPISLEEMLDQEAMQWQPQPGIPDFVQMDISYVKEHATIVLDNNSNDLVEFKAKAQSIINQL
jgi:hypothetical protein